MIWPGENTNVVLSYVNKGRADIYNLTAKIEGNIDDPNRAAEPGKYSKRAIPALRNSLFFSSSRRTAAEWFPP